MIYSGMGLLTCLIRRDTVKQVAAVVAPLVISEMSEEDKVQLEVLDVSIEKVTIRVLYLYCFLKWPEAIHSNSNVLITKFLLSKDHKNVQR